MYSMVSLLPDRRSGFVLLINGNGGEARSVLGEALLKHFTAPGQRLRVNALADEYARAAATPTTKRVPDTGARSMETPADLGDRLGVWRDPWFGRITLCAQGERVRFAAEKSPLMAGTLMRVGDRDLVQWDDASVDAEAWLDFAGEATRTLTMSKVDPGADFSFDFEDLAFTREGDCAADKP
jgi:hypothetical protein